MGGPGQSSGLLAIVPLDWSDGDWPKNENRGWAKQSPTSVTAPITPGEYTLIYGTGRPRGAGSSSDHGGGRRGVGGGPGRGGGRRLIDVPQTGPGNKNDFVAIVPLDWEDGDGRRTRTVAGRSRVRRPDGAHRPGAYVLIYGTGQGREALSRRPITVVAAEVSVAPAVVVAGGQVDVQGRPSQSIGLPRGRAAGLKDGDWPESDTGSGQEPSDPHHRAQRAWRASAHLRRGTRERGLAAAAERHGRGIAVGASR